MTIQLLSGDCRKILTTLPDQSVHCCVTSPPYFGLRDYGTGTWEGGDEACSHTRDNPRRDHSHDAFLDSRGEQGATAAVASPMRQVCSSCGAVRVDQQIGLEQTPEAYVAALVEVFREVRRVLRDDGTLWLNLGDSYAGSGRAWVPPPAGLKQKDLIGIPWMVAFALRADGWWLRQDIIWSKPNPMPESVTDRCTKAHEYLFLLSKSERYYYDQEAIMDPIADASRVRLGQDIASQAGSDRVPGKTNGPMKAVINETARKALRSDVESRHRSSIPCGQSLCAEPGPTRNRRSVWTVTTKPFKGAHFATFPPELIEPCILAGAPEGGTVLDPFGGAGTTGLVADRLHRNAVLIELNPEYVDLADNRVTGDAPLFAEVKR